MSEVIKYKAGQRLTHTPTMKTVWVVHNTLKAGGVNSDEATIWVEGKGTGLMAIPVAVQELYLQDYVPMRDDDENEETVRI